jgi:hypothetical protein
VKEQGRAGQVRTGKKILWVGRAQLSRYMDILLLVLDAGESDVCRMKAKSIQCPPFLRVEKDDEARRAAPRHVSIDRTLAPQLIDFFLYKRNM